MGKNYHNNFRIRLAQSQDWKCWWCQCELEDAKWHDGFSPPYNALTVDHFIPKASGGCNSVKNKVAACYACNQARGCMEPSVPRAAVMKRREFFVKRWEQKRNRCT